jgi:hypothetical protein
MYALSTKIYTAV